MSLANRLKELRRALSWTQQDLSDSSGLTRSYISRLEMGDIALPSSDKLRSLAQALGTSPDDLLQAAGYLDNPSGMAGLPEIKVYLRRKYAMQDARAIQAIETIINCLNSGPRTNSNSNGFRDEDAPASNGAEQSEEGAAPRARRGRKPRVRE